MFNKWKIVRIIFAIDAVPFAFQVDLNNVSLEFQMNVAHMYIV